MEGTLWEKDLRGKIVAGKVQVADTLRDVSGVEEVIAAAEQEVIDEEREYDAMLAAKVAQLQSLKVRFILSRLYRSLTSPRLC